MTAIKQIEDALKAGPTAWEYDANQTPFYNDADGHSRGGNSDGTYCLYGLDFFIDGERYEGPVLVDCCSKKDAVYIASTNSAAMREVLAHIAAQDAEIARLREGLEKLARLGNGESYGNSLGNDIAIATLTTTTPKG